MEGSSFMTRLTTHIKDNLFVSALISLGMICLVIGLMQYFSPASAEIKFKSSETVMSASTSAEMQEIVVDVSGAVESPGVYVLDSAARLKDALKVAGGLSVNADRDYVSKSLNLASKLHDGLKIYIPRVGEESVPTASFNTESSMGVLSISSEFISINSASQAELEELPGIGPVTAQKIINSRPYSSLEELVSKKSVGQSLFGKIKDQINL